jgi:hypothetical protein
MWFLTSKKTVRGQVSEEVAGMAVEILAAEPLQQRVMSVANSLIIERLSDPATVAAASSMTVRVLDQQRTENATRGVLFNMLGDNRAEAQVTELFVRVGGKAETKDAVVTVFRNAFKDDSATQIGAEYVRRVVSSPPVVGTCGGTASEQFRLVLNAEGTRQHTHELVASVLETESVQRHAADFVWASLIGAERIKRKSSQRAKSFQQVQLEQAMESAESAESKRDSQAVCSETRAHGLGTRTHGLPAVPAAELALTTSEAEGFGNNSNIGSSDAEHSVSGNVAVVAGSRISRLVARLDSAERLLASSVATRNDGAEACMRRSRLVARLDEAQRLLASSLVACSDGAEACTRISRLAARLDEAEYLLASSLAARIDEAERVLASKSGVTRMRDAVTSDNMTTMSGAVAGSWGSTIMEDMPF